MGAKPLIRFTVGDVRLTVLGAGTMRLDGGAMFGLVPRPMWSRAAAPDERNRISMAMNLLLIEDGVRTTLVDTGAGDKHDAKFREIHALEAKTVAEALAPAGLGPEQIDRVINTHLHFDHAGGNTTAAAGSRGLEAALPNAEYVVQSAEIDTARQQDNARLRAAYSAGDFEPLAGNGERLRVVSGDVDLDARIRLRLAPGHTPGMQIVTVSSGGETVAFLADLVPMSPHVAPLWIMAFDLEPLVTLSSKKRILHEAVEQRWKVVLQHDPEMPLAVLEEEPGGRLRARPWEPAGMTGI